MLKLVRYAISHKTTYEYNGLVSVSNHVVRQKPRELPYQHTLQYELHIDRVPVVVDSHQDYFGNTLTFLSLEGPHRQLVVCSHCQVEVLPRPTPVAAKTVRWETVRDLCRGDSYNSAVEACQFAFASPLVPLRPEFVHYAAPAFPPGRPILEGALELMHLFHSDFKFDADATSVATPVEQVFRHRRGVCQDFAHLLIACLRGLGLPARYVSGYLETVPPPGQPRLLGADSSHAWLQLWCGPDGWVDLDPTNNLLPAERHVTLGWGRDFTEVSPLRGVLVGSGSHQLEVAVDVTPLT